MRQIIVDNEDKEIGLRDRAELLPSDIYRVTALWLTNSAGEVLLGQRVFTKKIDPGVWGPAVAGTVEEGETYDSNIVKETAEEIGVHVRIEHLKKGKKVYIKGRKNDYFLQWYFYSLDKAADDFVIALDEVERVGWFTPDTIRRSIAKHPEQYTFAAPQWADYVLAS